jgi:uncharacterized protein (TIGR00297 family)
MATQYWVVMVILAGGMLFSVKAGKLTLAGAMVGGLIGWGIFIGTGFTGLAMLATFFVLGTGATAWQAGLKESLGLTGKEEGRRTAGQVVANAGVAAILGALAWYLPEQAELCRLMLAATFASATADTVSSELGNVYGRRFYNILTFRKDARGLNGVVSLEGTLAGVLGSALIGGIYGLGFGWNLGVVWIILAGTLGNITDSVLGATLERRQYLSNNGVNFLNTALAALVAFGLYGAG